MEQRKPIVTLKRTAKKRLIWSPQLHKIFVDAVNTLGKKGVPKAILAEMKVDGLTRENIASHLQKYRLQLRAAEDPKKLDSATKKKKKPSTNRKRGKRSSSRAPKRSRKAKSPVVPVILPRPSFEEPPYLPTTQTKDLRFAYESQWIPETPEIPLPTSHYYEESAYPPVGPSGFASEAFPQYRYHVEPSKIVAYDSSPPSSPSSEHFGPTLFSQEDIEHTVDQLSSIQESQPTSEQLSPFLVDPREFSFDAGVEGLELEPLYLLGNAQYPSIEGMIAGH